ncbi:unnamed protein product [Adineta ricciae]|uniref:NAD(P)(+)--arginine ADP-ribosyltransferase n=1 Tax=Adineta ricciae TaxID=249248 RepID=A0A815NUR0_ADIRI|nr:unnamed protein product [Adineta ricciae]CAF1434539.1 unnamed protein product [Adineta ricciae]
MGGSTSSIVHSTDENLESLSLIWLDANVDNSIENVVIQNQLRSIVNYLKTFQDATECENYIRSMLDGDRVLFIVSGRLGQYIVPRIHKLRQILAIYVFCCREQDHKEWAKKFTKVKGLFTKKQDLISSIQSDRGRRKQGDEPILFSVQGQSTSELNGQFVHSQIFIDILLRIKPTQEDRDELNFLLHKIYKGNASELAIVKEFDEKYRADDALWWYTRESFVYRLLNKALRVQNIDILFLFRFFIIDLQQQLAKYRCTMPIRLYRGQKMCKDEVQMLRNSIGRFVSFNSFLSTSTDSSVAHKFLMQTSGEGERVLFQIDADPTISTKPFADITQRSHFCNEKEVLIMLGSIFRIIDSLHGGGEKNLLSFGNVLAEMGRFDEAEKYYFRLLKHLSADNPDTARCYHGLGNIADEKEDYDASLEWHQKSLQIRTEALRADHPHLAANYISIGCAFFNQADYQQAFESFEKAHDIIETAFGASHPDVAVCLNNMGCVYEREQKYITALRYHEKALRIRLKCLPEYHPDVAQSYHNIGNIYRALREYDVALENYQKALEIQFKSLPSDHRDIAFTLENIGNVYNDKENFQEALSYYKKAEFIYDRSLPPTHMTAFSSSKFIYSYWYYMGAGDSSNNRNVTGLAPIRVQHSNPLLYTLGKDHMNIQTYWIMVLQLIVRDIIIQRIWNKFRYKTFSTTQEIALGCWMFGEQIKEYRQLNNAVQARNRQSLTSERSTACSKVTTKSRNIFIGNINASAAPTIWLITVFLQSANALQKCDINDICLFVYVHYLYPSFNVWNDFLDGGFIDAGH